MDISPSLAFAFIVNHHSRHITTTLSTSMSHPLRSLLLWWASHAQLRLRPPPRAPRYAFGRLQVQAGRIERPSSNADNTLSGHYHDSWRTPSRQTTSGKSPISRQNPSILTPPLFPALMPSSGLQHLPITRLRLPTLGRDSSSHFPLSCSHRGLPLSSQNRPHDLIVGPWKGRASAFIHGASLLTPVYNRVLI